MYRFIRLLQATDPELSEHGQRASRLADDIATQMALTSDDIQCLRVSALLHDVGKVFIPRDILDEPGSLTEAQWVELRHHPRMGYELIRDRVPAEVAQIVLTHHERVDGSGYPNAVSAAAIPLGARVLQVADAMDAITSTRPYQPALPLSYALDEMVRYSGTQFDASVVEAIVTLASNDSWAHSRFADRSAVFDGVAV